MRIVGLAVGLVILTEGSGVPDDEPTGTCDLLLAVCGRLTYIHRMLWNQQRVRLTLKGIKCMQT